MFQEVLQNVVDGTEGSVGGLLMGYDGIPLDHYVRPGSDMDVQTVGMEFSVILKRIREAAEMLEAGGAQEVSIQAENLTTVIRMLNEEYFFAVALQPHGNAGKARYLMRIHGPSLLSELE